MIEYVADGLKTMHIACDDVPFVTMEGGLEYRLLQARPADNLTVTQLRAEPGAASRWHRHMAPVFGYTTKGVWGHDRSFEYRPGTYIYETPGVLHRFMNGDEVTEALFISLGDMQYIDPSTQEIVSSVSTDAMVESYLTACEESGLRRPNVLG